MKADRPTNSSQGPIEGATRDLRADMPFADPEPLGALADAQPDPLSSPRRPRTQATRTADQVPARRHHVLVHPRAARGVGARPLPESVPVVGAEVMKNHACRSCILTSACQA